MYDTLIVVLIYIFKHLIFWSWTFNMILIPSCHLCVVFDHIPCVVGEKQVNKMNISTQAVARRRKLTIETTVYTLPSFLPLPYNSEDFFTFFPLLFFIQLEMELDGFLSSSSPLLWHFTHFSSPVNIYSAPQFGRCGRAGRTMRSYFSYPWLRAQILSSSQLLKYPGSPHTCNPLSSSPSISREALLSSLQLYGLLRTIVHQ